MNKLLHVWLNLDCYYWNLKITVLCTSLKRLEIYGITLGKKTLEIINFLLKTWNQAVKIQFFGRKVLITVFTLSCDNVALQTLKFNYTY